MRERSAEFLRGAVAALEKTLGFRSGGLPWVVPMSHQERVSVWDNYRISLVLAEAEAREALDKSRGQLCTCQSHQFVQCRGPESLGKGWVCAKQQEQDRKAREAALDAAAVIAQCKAALSRVLSVKCVGSTYDLSSPLSQCKQALTAISAWEAGR